MATPYKYLFLLSSFLGVCLVAFVLLVGSPRNAQGEFFNLETGNIDVIYVLLVSLFWFLVAFIPSMGVGSLIVFLMKNESDAPEIQDFE